MKMTLRLVLSAVGVAALLDFSAMAHAQSITAIYAATLRNNFFQDLGHGLQVATICHDNNDTRVVIAFQWKTMTRRSTSSIVTARQSMPAVSL
jgi:hypothetical protein